MSRSNCRRGFRIFLHRHWLQVASVVALAGFLALARSSSATIVDSPHDFSALNANHQICVFCHTPHNADTSVVAAPLWNHTVTQKQFVVYNSPTMDATVNQPEGASRLCLSCHDGTVAVDAYGGMPGNNNLKLGGELAVGADELNNDHPVSFLYDDQLAAKDGELFPPSSSPSGLGGTIEHDLLFGGNLECSSCHDVHNGPAAAAVDDHLLVIRQSQSQLCLTCHNK